MDPVVVYLTKEISAAQARAESSHLKAIDRLLSTHF